MHQVAIKPLYEGQVRPQDFAWFENEYGYWFGHASHPAPELAKRGADLKDKRQAHQLAGQPPSRTSHTEVRAALAGIRRRLGTAPRRKAPLVSGELRRLAAVAGPTPLADARDRALLLLGFAGALRRSELAALDA